MKTGSNIQFNIEETMIAYIALFMSPSPRRIPLPPIEKMNADTPKNNGVAYLFASINDWPEAP